MEERKGKIEDENIKLKEIFGRWAGLFWVLIAAGLIYLMVININYIFSGINSLVGMMRPVIYGCIIAYILNPLMKMYQRWLTKLFTSKGKQISNKRSNLIAGISIALALVTGLFIITILCLLVIPQMITSVITLINTIPDQAQSYYQDVYDRIMNNKFLQSYMQDAMINFTDTFDKLLNEQLIPWLRLELLPNINVLAKQFLDGITSFVNVLYNLFIGMIVAIYLLSNKRIFSAQSKKLLYGIFRKKHVDVILYYLRISNNMFSGFISGKIVDSTIIGLLCFICMSIMGLPYALLVSVIVGVTNVIPVFGPYIGAIPSTLLILLVNPTQALYFLILVAIIQQIDGNIIGPAILGESTGLSAFWVLFSILFFGGIWGIVGMLIGCPLFAVIYRIIKDFVSLKLRAKKLSSETGMYIDLKEINMTEDEPEYIKYTQEELNSKKKKKAGKKQVMDNLNRIKQKFPKKTKGNKQ